MLTLGPQVQIDRLNCISWVVDLPPCQSACPLGIEVEKYIEAVRTGDVEAAIDIIREKCDLPAVIGRICHAPCENACKRQKIDRSVAIRQIKRFVADHPIVKMISFSESNKPKIKEKVAIIGGGPGGLACAADLARTGYNVTIFEAQPMAGGMLQIAIPEYRLPKSVLKEEIEVIRKLGVEIKTNSPITEEYGIDKLFELGYKAIFIAVGAHKSRAMNIPGEENKNVVPGLTFLRDAICDEGLEIGKKIAVIGGGNVALDAARTALRKGSSVTVIYRRSRDEMPAYDEEIILGEEEGLSFIFEAEPIEIHAEKGRVRKVSCLRTQPKEEYDLGRRQRERVPNSNSEIDVDMVITAIGEDPNLAFLTDNDGIDTTQWGTIKVDSSMSTTRRGVYAGGDVQSGPGSAVDAMASGRKAAESIRKFLTGDTGRGEEGIIKGAVTGAERSPLSVLPRNRVQTLSLPIPGRLSGDQEVNLGYTEKQAISESGRCLKCGTCNICTGDFGCVAIVSEGNKGKGSPHVDHNLCVGCGVCTQVCPYGSIGIMEVEE